VKRKKLNTDMKKRAVLFVVTALASITVTFAYDFEVDGIYYSKVDSSHVSVIQENYSYSGEIIIPSTVEYEGVRYNVNSIGDHAFSHCYDITTITLPGTITSIGDYAFVYCSKMTSIVIPNSVTSLGDRVFSGCDQLTSIILPDRMTHWGEGVFGGCEKLTSVTIPKGLTRIESGTFSGCSNLSSVIIPDGITSIGSSAFNHCYKLSSVSLPESVTTLGDEAFEGCSGLTSFNIPIGVTSIGNNVFERCTNLKSIFIPKNVSKIGYHPFPTTSLISIKVDDENPFYDSRDNCNALIETASNTLIDGCRNSTIPNGIDTIGARAFAYCLITSVVIPESVVSIKSSAFEECVDLTSLTLSEGLESIGDRAFFYCYNLTSLTIPNSVTSIDNHAFSCCYSLESLILPKKMTNIGAFAFSNCYALESVVIPDGIVMIGDNCFSDCNKLSSVTLPQSLTSIGTSAFRYCHLASIVLPKGLKKIKQDAFEFCSPLTHITCLATTPPDCSYFTTDYFTFGPFSSYGTLHVPSGCKDAYASDDCWKQFEIVEDIGEMAFGMAGEEDLSGHPYSGTLVEGYTNCFFFSLQDSVLYINGYYAGNPNLTTRMAYTVVGHEIYLSMASEMDKDTHGSSETQPLALDVSIGGCTEDYYYIYLSGYYGKTAIVDDYTLHETSFKGYGVRGFVREKPPKTDISTGQKDPKESSDVFVVGPTGVEMRSADGNGGDIIFDLQGNRTVTPAGGSIYIVNGKKVLFK